MNRIDYVAKLTAVNADVLSGSALDPMPGDGIIRVYGASTVNTATVAIERASGPNPTGVGAQALTHRGNGEVRDYDPHWETVVRRGEKVTIGLGGTTGTVYLWISYLGGG